MLAARRQHLAVRHLDLHRGLHTAERRDRAAFRPARRRTGAASDRRSARARTGRASASGRAGSRRRCNGPRSARRTSPCSVASLPCRSNTVWLSPTRNCLDLVGSMSCSSTRSNSAVFMPWIDDADGHSRNAICSSSQRLPRSAVAASGLPPLAVGVVEAAVLGGEKFAGREKLLLGEQRRHQARQRAAALMEFHRRRAPRRECAGRLAAGEAERLRHGLGVEAAQPADRGGGAERAEHARAVPAAGAERRIIGADADPRRHLEARRQRDQEIAAGRAVALGDRQRRRHHLRASRGSASSGECRTW